MSRVHGLGQYTVLFCSIPCNATPKISVSSLRKTLSKIMLVLVVFSVAPMISSFEFDEAVFYGESIQKMCHVQKGDMPLKLLWTFNSRPIKSNDAITITNVGARSSILAIPSVTEKHSGNYTCTASNVVASTNHTAILNVQGIFTHFPVCCFCFIILLF